MKHEDTQHRPEQEWNALAWLRVTPCGLYEPIQHFAVLRNVDGRHYIDATETTPDHCRTWQIDVPLAEVQSRMDALRHATVPAFPVSFLVCDGQYVELTIRGEYSELTLGWWTMAPHGAETFADFAYWIRDLVLPPDSEDETDDE